MRKLSLDQMKVYSGGKTSNRNCMILGGIATAFAIGGLWTVVGAAIIGATVQGCFD